MAINHANRCHNLHPVFPMTIGHLWATCRYFRLTITKQGWSNSSCAISLFLALVYGWRWLGEVRFFNWLSTLVNRRSFSCTCIRFVCLSLSRIFDLNFFSFSSCPCICIQIDQFTLYFLIFSTRFSATFCFLLIPTPHSYIRVFICFSSSINQHSDCEHFHYPPPHLMIPDGLRLTNLIAPFISLFRLPGLILFVYFHYFPFFFFLIKRFSFSLFDRIAIRPTPFFIDWRSKLINQTNATIRMIGYYLSF